MSIHNPLGVAIALMALAAVLGGADVRAHAFAAEAQAGSIEPTGDLKRGNAALRKGEYSDAERHFSKALELAPENVSAQLGLGLVYLKQRQYVQSAEVTVNLLTHSPDHPRALALLGMSLMRVGLLPEALAAFAKSLGINGSESLALAGLAEIAIYDSDYPSSLRLARRAVRTSPNEPDYLYLLGQAAARQEQFREAADAYTLFLDVAPKLDRERREKIRGLVDLYRALAGVNLYNLRGPESVDVPFHLSSRHLPVVEATVNGKGPFRFVIDTGSGFMVLSEDLARSLKIRAVARGGNSQGVGGSGTFPIVYELIRNFGIAGVTVENVPTYVRRFYHNTPNPDGTLPPAGDRVDGFIGLSVIARFRATVDYGGRRLELRPKKGPEEVVQPGDFVLSYRVTTGGMLSVPADIGAGRNLNFIIDTGATSSVVSTQAFTQFGLHSKLDRAVRVRVTGAGGITEGVSVVVLDKLSLLGPDAQELQREFVRALVLDLTALNETAGFQQSGIIGSNVLRHYRLGFDFTRGRLLLRPLSGALQQPATPGPESPMPTAAAATEGAKPAGTAGGRP